MRLALFVSVLALAACKKEAEVEPLPEAPAVNPATSVSVTLRNNTTFTEMELQCKADGVMANALIVGDTVAIDGATSDCWIFFNPGRVSFGPVDRGAQLMCFVADDGSVACK